jgi:hypothetical protein
MARLLLEKKSEGHWLRAHNQIAPVTDAVELVSTMNRNAYLVFQTTFCVQHSTH